MASVAFFVFVFVALEDNGNDLDVRNFRIFSGALCSVNHDVPGSESSSSSSSSSLSSSSVLEVEFGFGFGFDIVAFSSLFSTFVDDDICANVRL